MEEKDLGKDTEMVQPVRPEETQRTVLLRRKCFKWGENKKDRVTNCVESC